MCARSRWPFRFDAHVATCSDARQAVGGKKGRTAVSVPDLLARDGCVRLTLATRKIFLVLFF